jgi:hypothetical protein
MTHAQQARPGRKLARVRCDLPAPAACSASGPRSLGKLQVRRSLRRTPARSPEAGRGRRRPAQFVTVTDGACPFQLAISDDTCVPELKSTRSQSGPDQFCTVKPASGTAVTSCAESAVTSSVTRPPSRL